MTSEYCAICGEYKIWNTHTCKPKFYVWASWDDISDVLEYERCYLVFARDEEDAAITYAQKDWEFPDSEDVHVISEKDLNDIAFKYDEDTELKIIEKEVFKKSKKFSLESELIREFMAYEIRDE